LDQNETRKRGKMHQTGNSIKLLTGRCSVLPSHGHEANIPQVIVIRDWQTLLQLGEPSSIFSIRYHFTTCSQWGYPKQGFDAILHPPLPSFCPSHVRGICISLLIHHSLLYRPCLFIRSQITRPAAQPWHPPDTMSRLEIPFT
jgi:hypothetical protein